MNANEQPPRAVTQALNLLEEERCRFNKEWLLRALGDEDFARLLLEPLLQGGPQAVQEVVANKARELVLVN
jgi:hypothetical protein